MAIKYYDTSSNTWKDYLGDMILGTVGYPKINGEFKKAWPEGHTIGKDMSTWRADFGDLSGPHCLITHTSLPDINYIDYYGGSWRCEHLIYKFRVNRNTNYTVSMIHWDDLTRPINQTTGYKFGLYVFDGRLEPAYQKSYLSGQYTGPTGNGGQISRAMFDSLGLLNYSNITTGVNTKRKKYTISFNSGDYDYSYIMISHGAIIDDIQYYWYFSDPILKEV